MVEPKTPRIVRGALRSLDQLVGVRVPAPQPHGNPALAGFLVVRLVIEARSGATQREALLTFHGPRLIETNLETFLAS
jgi:hypothetical protein